MIPRASMGLAANISGFEAIAQSATERTPSTSNPPLAVGVSHGRRWTYLEVASGARRAFPPAELEPGMSAMRHGVIDGKGSGSAATPSEACKEGSEDSFWSDEDFEAFGGGPRSKSVSPIDASPLLWDVSSGSMTPEAPAADASRLSLLERRRLKQRSVELVPLTVDCEAPIELGRYALVYVGTELAVTPSSFLDMEVSDTSWSRPSHAQLPLTTRLTRALFEVEGASSGRISSLRSRVERIAQPVSLASALFHQQEAMEELFGRASTSWVIQGQKLVFPDVRDLFYGTALVACLRKHTGLDLSPRLSYSISRLLGLVWFVSGRLQIPNQVVELKRFKREVKTTLAAQPISGADLRRLLVSWSQRSLDLDRALSAHLREQAIRDGSLLDRVWARISMDPRGIEQAEALGADWHDRWSIVAPLLALAETESPLELGRLASCSHVQAQQVSIVARALWCLHQRIDWQAAWSIMEDPDQCAALCSELCAELDTRMRDERLSPIERLTALVEHPLVILRQADWHLEHMACDEWARALCLQQPWSLWAAGRLFPELPGRLPGFDVDDLHKLVDNAWMLWIDPQSTTQDLEEWLATLEIRYQRLFRGPLFETDSQIAPATARKALNNQGREALWGRAMSAALQSLTSSRSAKADGIPTLTSGSFCFIGRWLFRPVFTRRSPPELPPQT